MKDANGCDTYACRGSQHAVQSFHQSVSVRRRGGWLENHSPHVVRRGRSHLVLIAERSRRSRLECRSCASLATIFLGQTSSPIPIFKSGGGIASPTKTFPG